MIREHDGNRSPDAVTPLSAMPLNEVVYRELLDAIVSGKLLPGTPVTIGQLAKRFAVSLMPVREALRKLEADNLITVLGNRRIIIRELSSDELSELLEIRLDLESKAARKSAGRCTDETIKELDRLMGDMKRAEDKETFLKKNLEFHFTLYRDANSPILLEIIRTLWTRVSPYLHVYVIELLDYEAGISCHEGMLQGMRNRNPEHVVESLKLDLEKGAEILMSRLSPDRK